MFSVWWSLSSVQSLVFGVWCLVLSVECLMFSIESLIFRVQCEGLRNESWSFFLLVVGCQFLAFGV